MRLIVVMLSHRNGMGGTAEQSSWVEARQSKPMRDAMTSMCPICWADSDE